jgi:hypothetical protein
MDLQTLELAYEIEGWMREMSPEQRDYFKLLVDRHADPAFAARFARESEKFKRLFFEERMDELASWFAASLH